MCAVGRYRKFICISRDFIDNKSRYRHLLIPYMQGIVYPNGIVKIGTDMWRILDKTDFPSYRVETYIDIEEAKKKYYLYNQKSHRIIFTPSSD